MHTKMNKTFKKILAYFIRKIFPSKELYINLGGGNWFYPRWKNIDYYSDPFFADYRIEFNENQTLPFKDNSVEVIFSSHVLEHLFENAGEALLKECFRVLKPDGLIRVSVPDYDIALDQYLDLDKKPVKKPNGSYGHITKYNYEILNNKLKKAGFKQIVRSSYRGSSLPVLRGSYFDNNPTFSLFLEAKK